MTNFSTELGLLNEAQTQWEDYAELLQAAPGIDPLAADEHGRRDAIPADGLLVTAAVRPGAAMGGVRIDRYGFGELKIGHGVSQYDSRGIRYASLDLAPNRSTSIILCTPIDRTARDFFTYGDDFYLPAAAASVTYLREGGRALVVNDTPMTTPGTTLFARSFDPLQNPAADVLEHDVSIVRAAASGAEAAQVLAAVGASMGLDLNECRRFVDMGSDTVAEMLPADSDDRRRLTELIASPPGLWYERLGNLALDSPDRK